MLWLLLGTALAAPVSGTVTERGTGDPVPGATLVSEQGSDLGTTGPFGGFSVDVPVGSFSD